MPTITLAQINEAVGIPLTAFFICESLGVVCNADGTWDAKLYGLILGRLQNHVLLKARKVLEPEHQAFINGFF